MGDLAATIDLLQLFAEPARVRLLALLSEQELSVAELTRATELGQSTVSTHLAKLRDAGLLHDRKAGASTFYAAKNGAMPEDAKRLWAVVHARLDDDAMDHDRRRCATVVRAREQGKKWPDAFAGEMERHYSPGRTWESLAQALLPLLALGDVLDAGSGDGSIAELVLSRARSVTCVDESERMIEAARARLSQHEHHARAQCVRATLEALPFADASFDQALLFNVLVHLHEPKLALKELARVLRPRGALLVVTLREHTDRDTMHAFDHRHPGFRETDLRQKLRRAGFDVDSCAVTSREKRAPHFEIVTAFAHKR
jgi:SAM-dependent methyltransferase